MSVSRFSRQSVQAGFPKQQNVWDGITQPAAMDPLSSITLTGSQASVNFNSIPQTYTHLQIRAIARETGAATGSDNFYLQFNNDIGSNYSWHFLYGSGSAAGVASAASATYATGNGMAAGGDLANAYGASIIDILDYANTHKNKTIRSFTGDDLNGSGYIQLVSGGWRNSSTNAITSITLAPQSNAFAQYSSFALYGIR